MRRWVRSRTEGTRYELALVSISTGGWIFCWLNALGAGRCMRIPRSMTWIDGGYVAEKMGISSVPDVEALLAWLKVQGFEVVA